MCAWLGSVDSLVNYDIEIQHLEKVVSQGVNKAIMEHLVKLYKKIALGYRLLAYMMAIKTFILLGFYHSHPRSSK